MRHVGKVGDIVAQAFEEVKPTAFRKKAYVFGEGGEDAAGEEFGDFFWGVTDFEVASEDGEFGCDFASDFGGDAGGVEGERIEPDGAEAGLNFWFCKFRQQDAEGALVGKGDIGFAGEGEVGVELDGMADVDDDE